MAIIHVKVSYKEIIHDIETSSSKFSDSSNEDACSDRCVDKILEHFSGEINI